MAQRVRFRKYLHPSRCAITTAALGSSASQLARPGPFPIRPGPSAGPPGKWKLSEMALRRSHTPHTRRPSLQPPGSCSSGCMCGVWGYGRVPDDVLGIERWANYVQRRASYHTSPSHPLRYCVYSAIRSKIQTSKGEGGCQGLALKGCRMSTQHRVPRFIRITHSHPSNPSSLFSPILQYTYSTQPSSPVPTAHPLAPQTLPKPPHIKYPPFCGRTEEQATLCAPLPNKLHPLLASPHTTHHTPHPTNRATAYRVILPVVRWDGPGITGENASVAFGYATPSAWQPSGIL
ncbi:hypothetical protein V501_09357 [Pseudogymnoascus sp. VKM F-4519 (FW-2642)]|nr:hypothetical protein V501_09357 [Pseudogymnoascus sp. VKM F-4519 (FW-2642)]